MTDTTNPNREQAREAAARAMCDRVNGLGDYDENGVGRAGSRRRMQALTHISPPSLDRVARWWIMFLPPGR